MTEPYRRTRPFLSCTELLQRAQWLWEEVTLNQQSDTWESELDFLLIDLSRQPSCIDFMVSDHGNTIREMLSDIQGYVEELPASSPVLVRTSRVS